MYYQNLRRRRPESVVAVSRTGVPLLTLEQGRDFLRSRLPSDDAFINATIMAVQRNVEAYAGIRIDEGTFDAFYSGMANELELSDIPATITSVHYRNQDGVEVTMTSGTDYVTYTAGSQVVRIRPESVLFEQMAYDVVRPVGFRIRYAAGHADLADVWPQVRTAMEHELALYFKNRQDGDQQAVVLGGELTVQARNLLDPIRERK